VTILRLGSEHVREHVVRRCAISSDSMCVVFVVALRQLRERTSRRGVLSAFGRNRDGE
jgi:hypothetical protein